MRTPKCPCPIESAKKNRGDHHSTGFVGTLFLLQGMPDFGKAELSCQICNQKEYPSWNTLTRHGVFMETRAGGLAQMRI
ncbi:MAG: hypothetical protein JXB18_02045 [Sedimentisphaerales bacterium]|nr:hypothetical protein [Sedimentisphaerales bacterium]